MYKLLFLLLFISISAIFKEILAADLLKKIENNKDDQVGSINALLVPFRIPLPPVDFKVTYLDFDQDGDIDAIQSITYDSIPVLWIDDDDDMKLGDLEGDTDSDCLLIDRNKNGNYGKLGDIILDWVDENKNQKADMQLLVEYPEEEHEKIWSYGHYTWVLDTDEDQVFNYIDWNTFQLKAWEHNGLADFFEDYSGNSTFLKVHAATNRMTDLRLNWENPFLFYDPDHDKLSEMAIRLVDSPQYFNGQDKIENKETLKFSEKIDWVSISVDLDNDNQTGNEFDFDFSLGFSGEGFDYRDQAHKYNNIEGLAAADTFFLDSRFRHLKELVFTDHDNAKNLIYNRGKWDQCWFVFDEDDDCNRWERVEFLQPTSPFKSGPFKGGIDNNPQSDASGDRGEWDLDNSGNGQIYIGKFDGRLHLYGAEWGCWRIDQQGKSYQGYDRGWLRQEPSIFPTVKYRDTDNNGFIDLIESDLDGDTISEETINLKELNIDDRCPLIQTSKYEYKDYTKLMQEMATMMWNNAENLLKVAEYHKLNTTWYAKLKKASSLWEKYNNGFWLKFYVFHDILDLLKRENKKAEIIKLKCAYYSSDWNEFSKILNQD